MPDPQDKTAAPHSGDQAISAPDRALRDLLKSAHERNLPELSEIKDFVTTLVTPGEKITVNETQVPLNGREPAPQIIMSEGAAHLSPAALKAAVAYGVALAEMQREGVPSNDLEALDRKAFAIDPDKKGISELLSAAQSAQAHSTRSLEQGIKAMARLDTSEDLPLEDKQKLARAEVDAARGNMQGLDTFAKEHAGLKSDIEAVKGYIEASHDSPHAIPGVRVNSADLTSDAGARIQKTRGRTL